MGAGLTIVIDYGLCNIDSMVRALEECGAHKVVPTSDPLVVEKADRIVLPGVGSFDAGMRNLHKLQLVDCISQAAASANIPFLGACLGMQLMAKYGEEGGSCTEGLGFVEASVVRLESQNGEDRVPHIGWNEVQPTSEAALFNKNEGIRDYYFVHSYHMKLADPAKEAGHTPYCGGITSVVELPDRPIFGTQFHPEKSQKAGFALLRNFLEI